MEEIIISELIINATVQARVEPLTVVFPAGCRVIVQPYRQLQVRGVRCGEWHACERCRAALSETAQHD